MKRHLETARKTGVMQLKDCSLSETPEQLAREGEALRQLDMTNNKLKTFPVNRFQNLKRLVLDRNRITNLPDDFGTTNKLEQLSLNFNELIQIPPSVSLLTHLKIFSASNNKLIAFPIVVCSCPKLEMIDLSSNKITSIPPEIGSLQYLQEVNLNQNEVSSISDDIIACKKLKTLRLEENSLPLEALTPKIMQESSIATLQVSGNLFEMKKFEYITGYEQYMERYTASKKKLA